MTSDTGRMPLPLELFALELEPAQPFRETELQLALTCGRRVRAPEFSGVNTLVMTATTGSTPDVLAFTSTFVFLPNSDGTAAFRVVGVYMGAPGTITVTADTGGVELPLALTLCQLATGSARHRVHQPSGSERDTPHGVG